MTREYHIVPAGACWETEEISSRKRILRSPTKRELVYQTMELARKERLCKIVIHNTDGSVEEEKLVDNNQEKKLNDF
jgi:hypothetical protein